MKARQQTRNNSHKKRLLDTECFRSCSLRRLKRIERHAVGIQRKQKSAEQSDEAVPFNTQSAVNRNNKSVTCIKPTFTWKVEVDGGEDVGEVPLRLLPHVLSDHTQEMHGDVYAAGRLNGLNK